VCVRVLFVCRGVASKFLFVRKDVRGAQESNRNNNFSGGEKQAASKTNNRD